MTPQNSPLTVHIDEQVKIRNPIEFVIPAKAGIQFFQGVIKSLDSGFHRSDDFPEFTRIGRGKIFFAGHHFFLDRSFLFPYTVEK
jgi:hypothetical protein